jgi:transposase
VKQTLVPCGRKIRVWFMDEARLGQQGTITNVWAQTGSRPRAVRQTRYEWVYLYAAVEPASGESAALLAPNVNTATMNAFLSILDAERQTDEHFILIMDQAGWHRSRGLKLPAGITVLLLPPYAPELNPTENLWHYLRSHYLSNRRYQDYDALLNAGGDAYRSLSKEVIQSVCRCHYLEERAN